MTDGDRGGGVRALVLAAGAGRRFGGAAPKQLAPFRGRPLLQHAIDLAQPLGGVLVLGAEADRVRSAVDPGVLEVVVCASWEEGQSASVRAGLSALPDADAVLVLLGDQPLITAAAIDRVLAAGGAHDASDARETDGADNAETSAVRAAYDGRPGHPVLLRRALVRRAHQLTGDAGFRDLLRDVALVECGDLADPSDVDTTNDLEVLNA